MPRRSPGCWPTWVPMCSRFRCPATIAIARTAPLVGATSVPFTLDNANKRGTTLDPADEKHRHRFGELVAGADILVGGGDLPAALRHVLRRARRSPSRSGGDVGHRFRRRRPVPVLAGHRRGVLRDVDRTVAFRPGHRDTGAAADRASRSATAAAQAAWAVLAAYYHRLRHGGGDYIDFSRFEAVVQALDPPFGSQGQAASGLETLRRAGAAAPATSRSTRRSGAVDGFVRICLLSRAAVARDAGLAR